MSRRDGFPKARVYSGHYSISFGRGERVRTLTLRPSVLVGVVSIVPLLALGCLSLSLLFIFRDDFLASLISREAEMQYAYEDRLASMRSQIERMKSRELVQEQAHEGRLHELFQRQAQLETRAALIASLAQRTSAGIDVTGQIQRPAVPKSEAKAPPAPEQKNPLLAPSAAVALPQGLTSFAPITTTQPFHTLKPHPDAMELRLGPSRESAEAPFAPQQQSALEAPRQKQSDQDSLEATFPARLTIAASALDRLERKQVETLAQLRAPAVAAVERLRTALAETGLSSERLHAVPGKDQSLPLGGPFVPVLVAPESSAFAREFSKVQEAVLAIDRMRRIISHVPLGKPLPGTPDVTSGFGLRIDPFLGRPAMHTGIDLRDDYGAPIRATAAGRIVTAEWTGGYGKMVEVDHGNGIATRYGHLSSLAVQDGQTIDAGAVLGRIGSSGRATGPHLHYEVRIDDEAVDPARFLRAAMKVVGADQSTSSTLAAPPP